MASAARFSAIVAKAKADVMISDEDHFSNYITTINAIAAHPSAPNPFIVGTGAVIRYLSVVRECSAAILANR